MPYLGPKTFATAPLTLNNLKSLEQDSSIITTNISQNKKIIINTKENDDLIINTSTTTNMNTIDNNTSLSSLSNLSSPQESISTPLSTISSNEDFQTSFPTIPDSTSSNTFDNETVILNNPITYGNTTILKSPLQKKNNSSTSISTIIPNQQQTPLASTPQLPHPLLRKKSGELVKSSLKLPSLIRSNSMPLKNNNQNSSQGILVHNKSVRFATVLEDVKFFNKLEKPLAISAENSPIQSPIRTSWDLVSSDSDNELSDNSDSDDYFSYGNNNTNKTTTTTTTSTPKWSIIKNDAPQTDSFDFIKFKSNKPVILDCVKLGSNKDSIVGFVFVKNLGFQKKITIRLTLNNWKTYLEIDNNSNYISSNHIFNYNKSNKSIGDNTISNDDTAENAPYDRFSFIIKLNTLLDDTELVNSNSIDLKFCLKYEVNNQIYWDSNNMKNYHIILSKKISKKNSISNSNKKSNKNSFSSFNTFKLDNDYFSFDNLQIDDDKDDDLFLIKNEKSSNQNIINPVPMITTTTTTTNTSNTALPDYSHKDIFLDLDCDLKLKSKSKSPSYNFDDPFNGNNLSTTSTTILPTKKKTMASQFKDSNYSLKKNFSAPSLTSLAFPSTSTSTSTFTSSNWKNTIPSTPNFQSPEKLLNFANSKLENLTNQNNSTNIKFQFQSPSSIMSSNESNTSSTTPNIPKTIDPKLYDNLIKNYCFFKSDSPLTSPGQQSSPNNSYPSSPNHEVLI